MKIFRIIFFVVCAAIACSSSGDCDCSDVGLNTIGSPTPEPVPIYPYCSATNQSRTPLFVWECDDSSEEIELTYEVDLYSDEILNHSFHFETEDKSLICPVTLEPEILYKWKITAMTQHGVGMISLETWFTTGSGFNNPPYKAQIIIPEHDGTYPLDVTFSWTGSDPDGDDLTYTVYIGTKDDPDASVDWNIVSAGQTETEYHYPSLAFGSEYFLDIQSHDAESTTGSFGYFHTVDPGEYNGIYAELTIHRSQWGTGDDWTRNDYVSARFDSVYAPDGPIVPKRPTAVYVGTEAGWVLQWQDYQYYYSNPYVGYFLGRGGSYFLTITGGDDVPSLVTDSIILPKCRLEITSPEAFSWISMDEGFELVWIEYDDACPDCDRDITIRIMDMGPIEWTDVNIVTENDGSYTFTADDLSGIDPAAYSFQIVLIIDNKESIIAHGYDPRSWIWARVYTTQFIYRQ